MKKKHAITTLLLALTLFFSQGCSKEKIQEDLIVQAMTSGRWIVVQFTDAGTDVSADFTPYEFQFLENETVQAINTAGNVVSTGTWAGNATTRTITANFPGNNTTLNRLNDTWKITNNTFTLVEANPSNTGRSAYLKLNKR